MNYRRLGKTGFSISEVSLGTWQLGGRWGDPFSPPLARGILEAAVDAGINFFDTADVYNDGLSEKAIGEFVKSRKDRVFVATKCGRRLDPHAEDGYTAQSVRSFAEDSLKNMALETLDLLQLHCPPTGVFYKPEVFEALERLKSEGKIRNFGVSVERVEEGIKALEYGGLSTIQIIFNMLRQRPADRLFEMARENDVGIIIRVPLASGLLTGKFSSDTVFGENDHRNYNRDGKAFDKGETFSGVDYETGLKAIDELKSRLGSEPLAILALRFILSFPQVSCVITGASRPEQIAMNACASGSDALTEEQMAAVRDVYERLIKPQVHHLW